MKEANFQDKIQSALRAHNVYVRSLVGNTLQAGLPDMLLIAPSGLVFHVENKVWRKRHPPTERADFVALLEGPQRRIITEEFWARGAYCPMLAFHEVMVEYAWLYDNLTNTITYNKWIEFVRYFARLPNNAISN